MKLLINGCSWIAGGVFRRDGQDRQQRRRQQYSWSFIWNGLLRCQCPADIKFVNGLVNTNETRVCCNEFDAWEGNK